MKSFIKKCAAIVFFVTDIAATEVYLYNDYGTGIIYRLTVNTYGSSSVSERVLGNSSSVQLYNTLRPATLLIRTNKTLSRFTDLKPYLQQIAREEAAHPGQDAYIYIKPSGLREEWNISINWAASGEMETDILEEILSGLHGLDYQKKTQEICAYDYTKATAGGYIHLCNALKKEANNVNKRIYKMFPGKKEPDPSTMKDLKRLIDQLHNALQKYRIRDNQ